MGVTSLNSSALRTLEFKDHRIALDVNGNGSAHVSQSNMLLEESEVFLSSLTKTAERILWISRARIFYDEHKRVFGEWIVGRWGPFMCGERHP